MDSGRHHKALMTRVLAEISKGAYPDVMAEPTSDLRRVRIPKVLWDAYEKIVGNGGRSADIKAYIEWRLDNPDTPLPGKRLGPIKKERKSTTANQGAVPTEPTD